ncbi:MAG: DUF1501 domain-containing protein [Acidimicrobiia bacterium]|nr:DUF1501 domain-containing protein [Acidimicrobiia bacterium]
MEQRSCASCAGGRIDRRDFLRVGSLPFLGIGLSRYLGLKALMASQAGSVVGKRRNAQACILLWLEGGPSQVDTWDPKPNSSFKAISTNVPGIQISELLPRVAKHMDKLAIIRSMHTEEIDHPEATHYAITGHRPNPAMQFPSVGSIIAKELGSRQDVPAYVKVPKNQHPMVDEYFKAAFIGSEYNPLLTPDPQAKDFQLADLSLPKTLSVERVEDRKSFLRVVDRLYRSKEGMAERTPMDVFTEQAVRMILSPAVKRAFDLSQESEKSKDAYGRNGFGQSVLLARRLVEAGCRFVTASGYAYSSWDTHAENDKNLRRTLVPPLDQSLSTLLEDLQQRGLLESTVVIAMGEFGRTPHINPGNGRDHWPFCWSLVLGGGGIKGGRVVGASDERGAQVTEHMVTVGDVFATIYKAFGIDWEKTYMTPIGRPIKIANSIEDKTGTPLVKLI